MYIVFDILLMCATLVLLLNSILTFISIRRNQVYCVTRVLSDEKDLVVICRSEQAAIKYLHMLNEICLIDKNVSYQIEKRVVE